MLKSLLRDRWLIFLLATAILVKLFSLNESWVERYYTLGFYPAFSLVLRFLLGWIPFSVGDLLYFFAFIYLVVKTWKFLRILARRQVKEYLSWILLRKFIRLVLGIYLVFNVFWGLNYNREGIASQLDLEVRRYSREELFSLTSVLMDRLNACAVQVDTAKREDWISNRRLFDQGIRDYKKVQQNFKFLTYRRPSIKSSLFSGVGHYFGFSGYFNPFSGEAQINSSEPVFVKPFVLNHEIAHQLGYGKENEASFVSFLACKNSESVDFRYSLYYELNLNSMTEFMTSGDTAAISHFRERLHPRARLDKLEEIRFRNRRKNRMQPYVSDFYDNYLRINNQPGGLATYNEVTAWLVAFARRYGVDEL